MFEFSFVQTLIVVVLVYFGWFVGKHFDDYWIIAQNASDNIIDSASERIKEIKDKQNERTIEQPKQ